MDIKELIQSRRTVHDYQADKPVPASIIRAAIETACWAPNHRLTEPWHFYLLQRETIRRVCELNRGMLELTKGHEAAAKKYARWMQIPGWLVVTCARSDDEIQQREDYAACSCAIQNLMLVLWEQGIGSKWSTGPVTREDRFHDLVWVDPEVETIIGLVWYGYAATVPRTVRKPVRQVLTELP